MLLEGSCHCGAVGFSVESAQPTPYQRCYCSICRKTGGGGGYMINLGGDAATLKVEGDENVSVYRATVERDGTVGLSAHARHFCKRCGSHLWAHHSQWPELCHPVASAIDTELPPVPERTHMMTGSRASWVVVEGEPGDKRFDAYPDESLATWHERHESP